MKRSIAPFIFLFVLLMVAIPASTQELPTLADLDEGWNYINLGGENVCAFGDDFGFFVHPGDETRLTIHLQVGGGCWDAATCQPGGLFTQSINPAAFDEPVGIFDMTDEENPLTGFSHVVIPSCNADVHLGSYTTTFEPIELEDGTMTEPLEFNFLGFTNASAVLDWVYATYPDAEQVVITGASAGSVGSIYHTPYIANNYPDASVVQIGDSFTGVFPEGFDGLQIWGAHDNLPTDLEPFASIDPATELTRNANRLYTASAEAFPDLLIGELTTANDGIQTLFWGVQGGEDPADWQIAMFDKMATLDAEIENFTSFIAGGDAHAIMSSANFYTYMADGTRYIDWFATLVNGDVPANVSCEATYCSTVELYEAE
ncbi:MAG: pectin acetylesterase-family hydrolase [Anaerolineae bacterium]